MGTGSGTTAVASELRNGESSLYESRLRDELEESRRLSRLRDLLLFFGYS